MSEYSLPPQNIEAEQSILSSCLLYPESIERTQEIIQPDDFYRTPHKKIYNAIYSLSKKRDPVDLVTMTEHLKTIGILEEIGGASYLFELTRDHPVSINVEFHASIVRQKSLARKFLKISQRNIQAVLESNGDLCEILETAQKEILNIGMGIKSESFCHIRDLTLQSVERYGSLMEKKKEYGIKTGYPSIDILTGGFLGSKLIIIAARPKIGKTAFSLSMARNMAKSGHMVGFFELEMDKEDIDDRWMAMETGINTMQLATGRGPARDQWKTITEAANRKYQWSILIDDMGGPDIAELKRRIRKMVQQGCQIIFIDQLSKIRSSDKRKGSWETNTDHVVELKQTAKELKTPIVLLVQLNRDVEKRKPPIPTAADFKLTGAIEEEADMAFLGYRRYPYTEKPEDLNYAWWYLALNRNGPTRRIMMNWEPKTTLFTEMEAE